MCHAPVLPMRPELLMLCTPIMTSLENTSFYNLWTPRRNKSVCPHSGKNQSKNSIMDNVVEPHSF